MELVCEISNVTPENPVLSVHSKGIFERRIIEKYLAKHGCDPVTGTAMCPTDLIVLNVVRSELLTVASIPDTLKSMQDDFDELVLLSFEQCEQLKKANMKLGNAAKEQHNAVCQVIARQKKRISAFLGPLRIHSMLPQMNTLTVSSVEAKWTPFEAHGLTPDIINKLQEKEKILKQKQERFRLQARAVNDDEVRNFQLIYTHSSRMGVFRAIDVNTTDDRKILTADSDKNARILNRQTKLVETVFYGHTRHIDHVIFHPSNDRVITASKDGSIRIWNIRTSMAEMQLNELVTGMSLHPTCEYLLYTSKLYWAFSDIRTGQVLNKVPYMNFTSNSAKLHPGGVLFGTGTTGSVKIWDIKSKSCMDLVADGDRNISNLSFSANGYYLATSGLDDHCVKLWDLRQMKIFQTIQLGKEYNLNDICFDRSGKYLSIAGSDLRVYTCSEWQLLKVFNRSAGCTRVRFSNQSQYIASIHMNRTLKLHGCYALY